MDALSLLPSVLCRETLSEDQNFLLVTPKTQMSRVHMERFLGKHWKSWEALTGQEGVAQHAVTIPVRAQFGFTSALVFPYTLEITEYEQHYVTCLARWAALRIGKPDVRRRVEATRKLPFVRYDGGEKCAVVPPGAWLPQAERTPESLGFGVTVDAEGFQSRLSCFDHMHDSVMQSIGFDLPLMRAERVVAENMERKIRKELARLSELWSRSVQFESSMS